MPYKKFILVLLKAAVLALGVAWSAAAHGPGGDQVPMGPGYGMGPGMMMGPGYGVGPGMMMGPGYGMGPGMGYGVAPGMMMGPVYGMGMGYGMGPGFGMGPGMWGPGSTRQALPRDLTQSDVEHMLGHQLAWSQNPDLKLGKVEEKDADTIVADIIAKDGSVVRRLEFDRHTGWARPVPVQ